VIDNLCADNFYYWWTLQAPLLSGGAGSKVLITTRNEKISQIISSVTRPILTGLDEEECWQLIQSVALPQGIVNPEDKRLVPIGKEIANRCNGFPMAASNLGEILNGKGEGVWSDVLCEMQALKDEQNVVLTSLRVRYHHLPYHLKQCFNHCSIFPKGYRFEKNQLIGHWIARGLIPVSNGHQPEAIGLSYFDDLLSRSFFEKSPSCDKGLSETYILRSQMYDLVRLNADHEPMGFNRGLVLQEPKPDTTEYPSTLFIKDNLSVKIDLKKNQVIRKPFNPIPASSSHALPEHFHNSALRDEVSRLRAPYTEFNCSLLPEPEVAQAECILESPIHFPSHLVVLDLSRRNLEKVPDLVGDLMHLRYLNFSHNNIKYVPESVCNLINLQTLGLDGCKKLVALPEHMSRLINLRCLDLRLEWEDITDSTEVAIPQGIGELNKLRILSRFNVNTVNGQDCNLIELKDLNLFGDLCILNLEKTSTPEDAMNANLLGKKFIAKLMLRWDSSAHTDHLQSQHSEEVINFLQPNNNLRCLWIINYPGTKYPDWMGYASFSRLETVRISNCKKFDFLPLVGQLPWLKNLEIDNVHAKTMSALVGFPSLEHLSLLNMPFLERIYLENEIPKLKKLYISDCPYLKELTLHRSFHNVFEKLNCQNLSTIIYVPSVEELPSATASDEQEVNENLMYQFDVGNTVMEGRVVTSTNELTEEEIEAVGESIKKWLRGAKRPLTVGENGEEERAAKRRNTVDEILQMVAAESCIHLQNDSTSNFSREVPGMQLKNKMLQFIVFLEI
jgi:Leucine-rich repeat (LRR) protein